MLPTKALLTKMDDAGATAWAFAFVLGLCLFWPLGLAVLAHLAWSGRLRALDAAPSRWPGAWDALAAWVWPSAAAPGGDHAPDRRLPEAPRHPEEERREFEEYLERLRRTHDKAEFDRFMAERRERAGPGRPAAAGDAAPPA